MSQVQPPLYRGLLGWAQGFIHPALLQTAGPHGQRAGLHCWCWWHHPHPQSWPHRLCGRAARVLGNGGKPSKGRGLGSRVQSAYSEPGTHLLYRARPRVMSSVETGKCHKLTVLSGNKARTFNFQQSGGFLSSRPA